MAKQITDKDILDAKEKYKSLSKKEKISYIWEYYKLHIIGGIIALIFVGSIINTTIINPPKESGLSLTFMDTLVDTYTLDEYLPLFNDLFIEDKEKYEVTVSTYLLNTDDVQYSSVALQRIIAQIQVAELDIVVADKDTFYNYAEQGVFYDLNSIAGISSGDYAMGYAQSEYDTEKKAYGISLLGCKFFEELGYRPDNWYIAIVVNTNHLDTSFEFIKYVLNSKDNLS